MKKRLITTNGLKALYILISLLLCSIVNCTLSNVPIRNFSYNRDINTKWLHTASIASSGICFDTFNRIPGINSTNINLSYVQYFLPALGMGASYSAFKPYTRFIPSQPTSCDVWFTYSNYSSPLAMVISARLLHFKYATFGFNLYPFAWPVIIGSASLIGTFHLPLNIDLTGNLHLNFTNWYVEGNNYDHFRDFDISATHSIQIRESTNYIFYSVSFESYRTTANQKINLGVSGPDLRMGLRAGYIFGRSYRRYGTPQEEDLPFTWRRLKPKNIEEE